MRAPLIGVSATRLAVTRTLLIVVGVAACVMFSLASPYFLSLDNLGNLLGNWAMAGLVAVPATFLIMSGQLDLSVGSTAALTGVVLARTVPDTGLAIAVLLSIGTGVAVGVLNGALVAVGQVDSVAATFASMALIRGLAYLLPSGLAVVLSGFRVLGRWVVFGVPLVVVIFAVMIVAGVLASRSAVGRRARAIGRHPAETRFDVGRDRRWMLGLFVASALAATLAGLVRTSELGTGLPTSSLGLELTVVTAVLLGGGYLRGGRGSVIGTLLAVLVLTLIDNGLSLANVTAYAGQVFHAALLVVVLVIDRPRRRRLRPGPDVLADPP